MTSAPSLYSSLTMLLIDFSLPGMADAAIRMRSPALTSTCLWLPYAMRYSADMVSPCEPVDTMISWLRG